MKPQFPSDLSPSELLDIIGGPGTGDAVLRGRPIQALLSEPYGLLARNGVGRRRVAASLELARRLLNSEWPTRPRARSPYDVASILSPRLRYCAVEEFWVLALNGQCEVIEEIRIAVGTANESLVHPREVFRAAIAAGAISIIVAHNHPSGSVEPSANDIKVTQQLVNAGRVVGIPVQDHIIIAGDRYYSFAAEGTLCGK